MSWCSRTGKRTARLGRSRRSTDSPSYPTLLSAESVAEINDLLILILSFLPIRALIRFKCVSKHWISLISNPVFSHSITSSKPQPISGLFLHGNSRSSYKFLRLDCDDEDHPVRRSVAPPLKSQLRFADHPSDMVILQSCNGLLLCQCTCSNQYDRNYYVYNPTTKQNTLLPPTIGLPNHVLGMSLAFDPSKSPHYKVVCLRTCDHSSDVCQIEVYSSSAGPWRLSGPPFNLPSTIQIGNTVYWNNAVHWFNCWGDCLSFDVEQEEIRILPLPNPDPEPAVEPDTMAFRLLDQSQGHLYFVQVNDSSSSLFTVYEMERDGSGWSPKYNVDLAHLAATFPEMIRTEYFTNKRIFAYSVISIVREERAEDSYIVLHIPNKAVRYNFKDKTFKKLQDFKLSYEHEDYGFYRICGSFQFVESLACV